jgi:signal transduction histidine kinase
MRHGARAKHMTTLGALLAERDSERSWISSQLYDDIGQTLSGVLVTLEGAESALVESERLKNLAEIRQRLTGAIDKLQHLARALHPPAVRDLGLAAALEQYLIDCRSLSGIETHLDCSSDLGVRSVPESIATGLFRIAEHALHCSTSGQTQPCASIHVSLLRHPDRIELAITTRASKLAPQDYTTQRDNVHYAALCDRVHSLEGSFVMQDMNGLCEWTISVPCPLLTGRGKAS